MKSVKITMYLWAPHQKLCFGAGLAQHRASLWCWAGSKFGITIKSECKECEINTEILEDMKRNEFAGKQVTVEIKPWLTYVKELKYL